MKGKNLTAPKYGTKFPFLQRSRADSKKYGPEKTPALGFQDLVLVVIILGKDCISNLEKQCPIPLNRSHQGGYCSSRGFQLFFMAYLLFKASLKTESSSLSSTFIASIGFARWWVAVTLLAGSGCGPGRQRRSTLGYCQGCAEAFQANATCQV